MTSYLYVFYMTQAKYIQLFRQIDKDNIFLYFKQIKQQEIVKTQGLLHARKNFQQCWKVLVQIILYI